VKNGRKLVGVLILFGTLSVSALCLNVAEGPEGAIGGDQSWMKEGTGSYGCTAKDIAHYVARRAAGPIVVDGRLGEPSWRMAEKSPRFVDMVTGQGGFYDTRVAVL